MFVVIGSVALRQQLSSLSFTIRSPSDVDVLSSYDTADQWFRDSQIAFNLFVPTNEGTKILAKPEGSIPVEIELTWPDSTAKELFDYVLQDEKTIRETYFFPFGLRSCYFASIDVLYTIKMSHRYKKDCPHFSKTMQDIHFLRELGAKIPDDLQDWYKRRQKETYNYPHPKLNVSKKNFFNPDQVQYTYDHDSIHEAVKHLDRPAYTYFTKDNEEVMVDKKKWEELDHQTKLYSVLEESYVLAIERSQVPFKGKIAPTKSFEIALSKVCTSISSGWWREFAWEHYNEVMDLFKADKDKYIERFWDAVENGQVKKAS